MKVEFEIEGLKEAQRAIEKLPDRLKAKALKKIYRKAARIMVQSARSNVPVSEDAYKIDAAPYHGSLQHKTLPHKRYSGGKVRATHMPGNLKKSIGVINSKSKVYPSVYVGPRAGFKYKYDGWYGNFLEFGTKYMPAQPFMKPAYKTTQNVVRKNVGFEVVAYIRKLADKKK